MRGQTGHGTTKLPNCGLRRCRNVINSAIPLKISGSAPPQIRGPLHGGPAAKWLDPFPQCEVTRLALNRRRGPRLSRQPLGGGFNRSTQHSSLLIWRVETVCIWRGACTDMVPREQKAEL